MKNIFLIFLFLFTGCFNNDYLISAKDLNNKKIIIEKSNMAKVIVFWQNDCSSCYKILPLLDDFLKENGKHFEIYAVNSVNKLNDIKEFSDKMQFKAIKIAVDMDDKTWKKYDIFALPTVILIDKNGKVVDKIVGEIKWQDLRSQILSLL